MIITDKMVIAAAQALDAHPWAQGKPMVPSWVIRAMLEAAVQRRSRDDADLEKRVRDMIYGIGLTGKERAKEIISTVRAAVQAAPAPTAAPGEYEGLCERLMDPKYDCSDEAAAAIRKLTAERDEFQRQFLGEVQEALNQMHRAEAAEGRVTDLEFVMKHKNEVNDMLHNRVDEWKATAEEINGQIHGLIEAREAAEARAAALEEALRQIANRTGAEFDEPWSQARAEAALAKE